MVIQRIYVQPPPDSDPTTTAISPAAKRRESLRQSSSDGQAGTGDSSSMNTNSPLKRTPSASTSKTVSRLLAQHTGTSYSEFSAAGDSRPASPLDGIRPPSGVSVLKPSDFARRKAAFMKSEPPSSKFHAELERRWSNPPNPLDLDKELAAKLDASSSAPRGTFVIPKLRSAASTGSPSAAAPAASSPLKASPTTETPDGSRVPSSPIVEIQVIELNKQLRDSTTENKTLAAQVSQIESKMHTLKEQRRITQPSTPEIPTPEERHVPKAEFDALVADTEKAARELEAVQKKQEERELELKALTAQAAKLLSKEKVVEAQFIDPQNVAAKESLEQAVERLREQVEFARRQSSEVVTRKASSASRMSERYAPSSTRVPLSRNRRTDGRTSESGTPPADKSHFEESKTVPVIPSRNPNRRSQVISLAPGEPIPERDDLTRSLRSYYSDAFRAGSPMGGTPLAAIDQSDRDEASMQALSSDLNGLMADFGKDAFTSDVLSLKSTLPASARPLSPLSRQTLRSQNSVSSLKGKKKGWISLFKVKLPGGHSIEDERAANSTSSAKAPVLAPISQQTPISLAP